VFYFRGLSAKCRTGRRSFGCSGFRSASRVIRCPQIRGREAFRTRRPEEGSSRSRDIEMPSTSLVL